MKRARPVRRAGRRTAFTLVELVTAASLMTVIMLGVVQVFGIVMQTVSDAQGIHFAQQQLRAMLNRLHNDLRGMTREGYLKIRKPPQVSDYLDTGPYSRDTLAFVTIGRCASAFAAQAYEGTAAEVVYTNNVKTPGNPLNVDGRPVDARRGILGRGQWMMTGRTGGSAGDLDDRSDNEMRYLCDLFQDQQKSGGHDRLSIAPDGHVQVYPWIATEGLPQQLEHTNTLKRVMASCVSEFHVEVFDPVAGGTGVSTGYFDGTQSNDYRNAWPRAIRVTVAVHDPADTELPQTDSTGAAKRFRGFALQEVFWLPDP